MKLWQILLGTGVLVGGVVLLSGSSSPAMPADPTARARKLCEHFIQLAVDGGRTVTRDERDQCYSEVLANLEGLTGEQYQCLMATRSKDDFLECARRWPNLGEVF